MARTEIWTGTCHRRPRSWTRVHRACTLPAWCSRTTPRMPRASARLKVGCDIPSTPTQVWFSGVVYCSIRLSLVLTLRYGLAFSLKGESVTSPMCASFLRLAMLDYFGSFSTHLDRSAHHCDVANTPYMSDCKNRVSTHCFCSFVINSDARRTHPPRLLCTPSHACYCRA